MEIDLQHVVNLARIDLSPEEEARIQPQMQEILKYVDKLNELEKKTSITGGYSNGKPDGEKAFDDMSDDEQKQSLLRAAMAHDDNL